MRAPPFDFLSHASSGGGARCLHATTNFEVVRRFPDVSIDVARVSDTAVEVIVRR